MKKKVAIVYDWIDSWGGAERILQLLATTFPHADFYTSAINRTRAPWAKEIQFHTSFIQRLPRFIRHSRIISVLLYPFAFESFDFSEYQAVISITSSFAKGIITRPETRHISYVLTPTRFIWEQIDLYINPLFQRLLSPYIWYIRKWDWVASRRPDTLLTLSKTVKKRIKHTYQLQSTVIYPPFDAAYWGKLYSSTQSIGDKHYYLVVSRLEHYKRVDLAIKTFRKLPKEHLIIVGEGRLREKLQQALSPNISIRSHISDEELTHLYAHAKALIMPQEEDFGYVALEALACHCPVIAYGRGGATETVIEGRTGILFEEQTIKSLSQAIEKFEKVSYTLSAELERVRDEHLDTFSSKKFIDSLRDLLS